MTRRNFPSQHGRALSPKSGLAMLALLLVSTAVCGQAAQPQSCPSLWNPSYNASPDAAWAADLDYISWPTKTPKGISEYNAGQTVILSKDTFPHLARSAVTASTNINTITIDGETIVVDMPLFIANGLIKLIGREIKFTQRGQIIFVEPPRESDSEGVKIVAETLDMTDALAHPFVYLTQDQSFNGRKRIVNITAKRLLRKGAAISPIEFARSLTIDSDYAVLPANVTGLEAYSANVGDDTATKAYQAMLDAEAIWPEQLAEKIARQHYEAPYDGGRRLFLKEKITSAQAYLKASRQDNAKLMLQGTKVNLDLGLDDLGQHGYYIPRLEYLSYKELFATSYQTRLDRIAQADARIEKVMRDRFDPTTAAAIRKEADEAGAAADTIKGELSSLLSKNLEYERVVQRLNQKIATVEITIKQRRDDDQKKEDTNRDWAKATKVVVMATAFLPVSAPVAIGIGTAVGAGSDMILARNRGEPQTLLSAGLTVQEALAKARAYNATASKVAKDWDGVLKDEKSYEKARDAANSATLTTTAKNKANDEQRDALGKTIDSMGTFVGSLQGLVGQMAVPEPTTLSLDKYEKDDPELQGLLTQVGQVRNDQAQVNLKLKTIAESYSKKNQEVNTLRQQEYMSRQLVPTVDRDALREERIAWNLRQSLLNRIKFEAAVLERGYTYHTGIMLEDKDSVSSRDAISKIVRSARNSRDSHTIQAIIREGKTDALKSALDEERKTLENALKDLAEAVDNGYTRFVNNVAAQHSALEHEIILRCEAENVETCRFIDTVNMELARQIGLLTAPQKSNAQVAVIPVNIPFPIPIRASGAGSFEKIYAAEIKVEGEIPKEQSIQFSLVHPSFGRLRTPVDPGCYTVDMRLPGIRVIPEQYTSSCSGVKCVPARTVELKDAFKKENERLVALPLEAPYYFIAEVRSVTPPIVLPKVTSLTVTLKYMR